MVTPNIREGALESAQCLDDCDTSSRRERIAGNGYGWLRSCLHNRILGEEFTEPAGDTCVVEMRITRDDIHRCQTIFDANDAPRTRDGPVRHGDSCFRLAATCGSGTPPGRDRLSVVLAGRINRRG